VNVAGVIIVLLALAACAGVLYLLLGA